MLTLSSTFFSWFTPTWFTQGLLHPLQTPAHFLLILGLALLLGQQKQLKILVLLPVALLAGFALNHYDVLAEIVDLNTELILLVLALICGLFLLLRLNLAAIVVVILSIVSALILGLDSSPIMIPGLGINSILSWRLGALVTMVASMSVLSIFARLLQRYWNGIILRVAGSWIATSTIFVLTLMLAGKTL